MNIGIVGLGLIGGSLAKTISARTAHTVYGFDTDPATLQKAMADGSIHAVLNPAALAECDLIALALFPQAIIRWLETNAATLPKSTVVFDCGGIKTQVCEVGFALAAQYGFTFIGGHPMAGTEHSGYAAARDGLFDNASMILVPPPQLPAQTLEALHSFFLSLGFARLTLTTAPEHDRTIAYTSQLAHVVSSAYIKSPTAQNYIGFSAGSFKDMTRVAFLNEIMWTELFLENRTHLCDEVEMLIDRLCEYRDALQADDADTLHRLLKDGRELKTLSEQREKKQ